MRNVLSQSLEVIDFNGVARSCVQVVNEIEICSLRGFRRCPPEVPPEMTSQISLTVPRVVLQPSPIGWRRKRCQQPHPQVQCQ